MKTRVEIIILTAPKPDLMNKRQRFLSSFFEALGAEEVEWTTISEGQIEGTVIYDKSDPGEMQNFRWAIAESESPVHEVQVLMDYIFKADLLHNDRLKKPVVDIEVPGLSDKQKTSAFNKLFDIEVRMIDNSLETDWYFILNLFRFS